MCSSILVANPITCAEETFLYIEQGDSGFASLGQAQSANVIISTPVRICPARPHVNAIDTV